MRQFKPLEVASVGMVLFCLLIFAPGLSAAEATMQFGFSKVDVTPDRPVRLSGYGGRNAPFEGVSQKLWTRAIAMRQADKNETLCVLVSVDSIGVPATLTTRIVGQLKQKHGISRDRFVLCSTHSHAAPQIDGYLTNHFTIPLTANEQSEVKRYTARVEERVVQAVAKAIEDLAPGTLLSGQGQASFAVNRRRLKDGRWSGFGVQEDGPVDHSLPVLKVIGADKKLRGLVFNYACHCTTLGGDFNQVNGDWAGYASEQLEKKHAGAVAVCTIGCGGDANPNPRGKLEMAQQHGRTVAVELDRVMSQPMDNITAGLVTSFGYAGLPFDRPSVAELKQRVETSSNVRARRHAEEMLEIHKRKGRLPETQPCPVHVWRFGDQLTMVFLAGEVVVDYALRLKREIDSEKVWVTAYTDDVFGYVASERLRPQGGYEVDSSMLSYNLPGRFSTGTEDVLIRRVHELLKKPNAERPLPPDAALKTFRLPQGLRIELVASEPLIRDPVNIAFGDDGRLWVVEMGDYPRGLEQDNVTGGRVKYLEDLDGDGRYDTATLFLDGLEYPNAVLPWRDGVLVCCAPEIFYAEDTNGDGKADVKKVLFDGFAEANPQHRVHGFCYGLDNWVYIGGDHGGQIRSLKTGKTFTTTGQDARIRPDSGLLESATGRSQFIRCRNDWGDWFGNNNSVPLVHYVIADRYIRRNPYVASPNLSVPMIEPVQGRRVFPASRTVDRFNDLFAANRFTSACSPEIYRDRLLGPAFRQTGLVCEPVHNLVHRSNVSTNGVTFAGKRFAADENSELVASSDVWSRPVRVCTGPQGAIWVVDMYRMVIEHPQWIPDEWQKQLNLRAGEDKGRVYRVFSSTSPPASGIPDLASRTSQQLVKSLESPNGWQRDTAQRLLVQRGDQGIAELLTKLAQTAEDPVSRLHALCTLDGLGALTADALAPALKHPDARLRRQALRLSEQLLDTSPELRASVLLTTDDPDLRVQLQLALTLGESKHADAGQALGQLAVKHLGDHWLSAAILSSATFHADSILQIVLSGAKPTDARSRLTAQLISTAIGVDADNGLLRLLRVIAPKKQDPVLQWQFSALADLLDVLDRRKASLSRLNSRPNPSIGNLLVDVQRVLDAARAIVTDESSPLADREVAIRLLARGFENQRQEADLLGSFLAPQVALQLQLAAIDTLGRLQSDRVPDLALARWKSQTPDVRADVLDLLLSRPAWTSRLLDAMEQQRIRPADLDAVRRERLVKHGQADIRRRVAAVIADAAPASRDKVLAEYQKALTMKGDVQQGAARFKKTCAGCHRFRDEGRELGANLTALKDRSSPALLTAILDPNRAVEAKFQNYNAVTQDGRIFSGMVVSQTASSVTLAQPDGKQEVILRADLDEFVNTGHSFMPEGLEKDLNLQDLADIFAFLQLDPEKTD